MKLSSITLMAMLTSSSVTYSLKCILACASAIRIIDSMWRTVIGIEPVACGEQHSTEQTTPALWFCLAKLSQNHDLVRILPKMLFFCSGKDFNVERILCSEHLVPGLNNTNPGKLLLFLSTAEQRGKTSTHTM